jgi:pyruvate formate lyase activating enzyme
VIVGGFQRFSLIDYPDKVCAVVFTQGCNFRCPYCHNPELVGPVSAGPSNGLEEQDILAFLERRTGKLDAVTVTGGEPLLQSGLERFLSAAKGLGYLVKLDTNGSFPSRLERILRSQSVDYVAMDIKTSPDRYENVVQRKIEKAKILHSIRCIMDSGLDYEFRTTVVGGLLESDDFYEIGKVLEGSRLYVLQRFVPSKTLDDRVLDMPVCTDEQIGSYRKIMEGFVQRCIER